MGKRNKKKITKILLLIGIAILLLTVGLTGCETNIISINELKNNADSYLNETVTVKGRYLKWPTDTVQDHTDEIALTFLEDVNKSMLNVGSEYYFTGVLKHRTVGVVDKIEEFYIEVSEIKEG